VTKKTSETFFVSSTIKKGNSYLKELPFKVIKEQVIGKSFILNLILIGDKKSRNLNRKFRNINKTSNILSFPLSKDQGDMFLNVRQAEREFSKYEMPRGEFIIYLFIHGLLHLKGMAHSSRMEKEERRILEGYKRK